MAARLIDSFFASLILTSLTTFFNKSAYLKFQYFVINPFCAITEQIRQEMDVYS